MKRIDASFADERDATAARAALREADVEPETPDVENAFLDPTVRVPELRLGAIGAVLGGIVGLLLLVGLEQYLFQVPRFSPITTAGEYSLAFLGLGVGIACGGFVGAAIGTALALPTPDRPRVAATVPVERASEVEACFEEHGATDVRSTTLYHRHSRAE